MNSDIELVFMTLRLEAFDETHTFTKEQRDALVSIVDKAAELDFETRNVIKLSRNILSLNKILKEYENKFKEYGGDTTKLEEKLKSIKKEKIKGLTNLIK